MRWSLSGTKNFSRAASAASKAHTSTTAGAIGETHRVVQCPCGFPVPSNTMKLKQFVSVYYIDKQKIMGKSLSSRAWPTVALHCTLGAHPPDSSALSGGLKNTLGTLNMDTIVSASAEQPMAAPAAGGTAQQQRQRQQRSTPATISTVYACKHLYTAHHKPCSKERKQMGIISRHSGNAAAGVCFCSTSGRIPAPDCWSCTPVSSRPTDELRQQCTPCLLFDVIEWVCVMQSPQ